VKDFPPAYFALVMATGILSIAARDLELPVLATVLFAFNLVAFAVLAALNVLRALRYPGLFLADMTDHRLGPGFFTSVAASCVLGTEILSETRNPTAAAAFLVLGVVLWIGLTYTIFPALAIKRRKPPLEQGIGGTWLIAVVAAQSIAVLAALIAREWPQPHQLELDFFALSMWLWGGMLYIWIISMIFYRLSFLALSPTDVAPSDWIAMGAMAISTLAGACLVRNAADEALLASLLPFLKGLTLFYWVTGTWWIPILVALSAWRYLIRRLPLRYDPMNWGAVFPLGMYATATRQISTTLHLPFLEPLAWIAFAAGLLAWTLALVGLLRGLGRLALARPS
jgi:tellurite resistance protein TehA-like permease